MNMPEMNMEQMQQMMMEQQIKQKLGYLSCKIQRISSLEHSVLLSSHFKGSVPCSYCVFIYFTTYFRCYHQRTA